MPSSSLPPQFPTMSGAVVAVRSRASAMVTRATDEDSAPGVKKHASEQYEAPFDYEVENGRLNVQDGTPDTKHWLQDLQSRAETAIWKMEEAAGIPHPDEG